MKTPTKVETSGARGSKIRTETGPDREKTGGGRQSVMGKKMGGSGTDLSHSFSGSKVKEV